MRHSVSVSLSGNIFDQLRAYCQKEDSNPSETIRRALREHFFHAELSRLRQKSIIEAQKRGIHLTQEEIYKTIS